MKELFGRIVTTEWLISNLLWEVVLLALSAFCITFLWKRIAYPRYQARKISIILLKENRPAIGQQHPKYLADRFIEIWSSTSVQGIKYIQRGKYSTMNIAHLFQGNSPLWNRLSDDELINLGLIRKDGEYVKPIKTLTNEIVVKKVIKGLIQRYGDNPENYKHI